MSLKHHFYAYISKLRWVLRWGLKRNAIPENVMEHSWEVATIAHALALIGNQRLGKNYDANLVATTALYHDISEVITGDLPTPIKYHSPEMQKIFKKVEHQAERELIELLPEDLQSEYGKVILADQISEETRKLIKGADTIAAYLKCKNELKAGNHEFSKAAEDVEQRLKNYGIEEVDVFLEIFYPSYEFTLDELLNGSEKVRNIPLQ